MDYLKPYLWIGLFLYIFLSLQIILWFAIFPYIPPPQIWISFLVYAALYTNKRTVTAIALMISLLLSPYTLFNSVPLFFSLLSYGYIVLYAKNTLLASNIKTFFMFSLLGFLVIQLFYSIYTLQNFPSNLQYIFNSYNIYSSLFTGLLSLLFFYFFKILNSSSSQNKTITWI